MKVNIKIDRAANCSIPIEVGYSAERIYVLEENYKTNINNNKLIGAAYILGRYGKVFANAGMGKLTCDDNDTRLVQHDSIMGIASMTKVFTSIAIMKLVEDGKMLLDVPVAKYIKEFDKPTLTEITPFHLLTHTSGICPSGGVAPCSYPLRWRELADNGKMNWIEANLATSQKNVKPNTEWMYSSFAFMLLGEIITRVTGVFAEDYIIENIVKPLGMTDTFFDIPLDKVDRIIANYPWLVEHLKKTKSGQAEPRKKEIPGTAGDMYSSLPDMYKLAQMLLNKGTYNGVRILGRKTVEKMTQNYLHDIKTYSWGNPGMDYFYGLGVDMRRDLSNYFSPNRYGHEGSGRSAMMIDPDEDFIAIHFMPQNDTLGWDAEVTYAPYAIMYSGII